jgi:hypothetical protein
MTRNALILIVFCVLGGVVYFSAQELISEFASQFGDGEMELAARFAATNNSRIVYALRNIGPDELIHRSDLEERELPKDMPSFSGIGPISAVEGFRTKERIEKGNMLTVSQVNFRKHYVKSVFGVNHMLPGSVVKAGDVVEGYASETTNAVSDQSMVVGKRVKREFSKADSITQDMIEK